jgi:6-phosphogluconolactonase (cycloisomerase 2 family)
MNRIYLCRWWQKAIVLVAVCTLIGVRTWTALAQKEPAAGSGASSPAGTRIPILIDRAPSWVTSGDPYDTFSGDVAVDLVRNELVLQTPFKLLVYDRLASTPPDAKFTEPKRIIAGQKTKMNKNCGLYVDSKTGEIYSIPNDIADLLVVFSPEAKGNVDPDRELVVPHTVYGLAMDEDSQELFLAVGHPGAVVVFPKNAKGNEPAIRIIEGTHTQLAYPHGVAVDTKDQLLFVSNHGSMATNKDGIGWSRWPIFSPGSATPRYEIPAIRGRSYKYVDRGNEIPGSGRFFPPSITVYRLKANGDTPPLRVIQGPKTQLDWPMHLYADTEHGELFVANDTGNSIAVFRTTDSGDVAPIRILQGPKTALGNPTGVYVDVKNDELVVSNMRNHSATVFRRTATGDTPPLRTVRNAPLGLVAPALGQVMSITYDTKRDEILVPN